MRARADTARADTGREQLALHAGQPQHRSRSRLLPLPSSIRRFVSLEKVDAAPATTSPLNGR